MIEKRWRVASNNTYLRGRGTSRSTYFAEKRKTEKLVESGRMTQKIANFFRPRQPGEQSAASEVDVPPLSTGEPVVVQQETDTGNETDDEVTFGVAAEKKLKAVKLSKDKEMVEMQKSVTKLLSGEAAVTRSSRIEKRKDVMAFKVRIILCRFLSWNLL
jgi:hypothetical protein